jgi:hypothetical protein
MLYERTIEASYTKLRKMLDDPYFVQWVTTFDSTKGNLEVVGFCVRDKRGSQWKTVFTHESETVCRKVCDMLNEEGANKC